MKRILFRLCGVIAFCSIVPFQVQAENLLRGDSSFEAGAGDWVVSSFGNNVKCEMERGGAFDGSQSIKLKFEKSDWTQCKLFSIMPEQEGKAFTFSIYAKADRDGVPARLYMLAPDWSHGVHGNVFALTKEWRRYSLTGKLKRGVYWLSFGAQSPCVAWCDAFQFEEGEVATEYRNDADVCIGVSTRSLDDHVFFMDETVPVSVQVANIRGGKLDRPAVSLQISDWQGKTVFRRESTPSMEGGRFDVEHDFIPAKLGFYAIRAELRNDGKLLAEASCSAAVVAPPVALKKGKEPFCGVDGFYLAGLDRIGNRWAEIGADWKALEPVRGQYRWEDISWAHRKGLKARLTIAHLPSAPPWAWDPADVADSKKRGLTPSCGGFLPSMEHMRSWREFIRALAVNYRGQVDIIEIGGEDDLTFGNSPCYLQKRLEYAQNGFLTAGPDYMRYAEMLKAACEEIRGVAPEMKIGIVRPSGVDCSNITPKYSFTSPAVKHCGNLFDLLPLDCYPNGPRYIGPGCPSTAVPEDFLADDLSAALEVCRVKGNGQRTYVSEIGYALDFNAPADSEYAMEIVKRLSRMYLVARMTPGVDSLHWFSSSIITEGKRYYYGMWRFGQPLPAVPAYSAVARVVENVEESRTLASIGGDSKAVVFRKDGRADAAVWFVHGKGKLACKGLPSGISVTDVMGNPVELKVEGPSFWRKAFDAAMFREPAPSRLTVGIDEFPVYFGLKGEGAFKVLCDALSQARMICEPVKLSLITPRGDAGILSVRNQVNEDVAAKISIAVDEASLPVKEAVIKKGDSLPIEIPLNGKASAIKVAVDCGEGYERVAGLYPVSFEHCAKIKFQGKMDGDLSKWAGRPCFEMNERSQIMPPDPWIDWKGPEHFSAKVYTGWDDRYFYLAAEVRDDVHSNRFPAPALWKGDSLQFAFSSIGNAVNSDSAFLGYGEGDFDLGIALSDDRRILVSQWAGKGDVWKGSEYVVKRDDATKRTFYEMKIPFAALRMEPAAGRVFGFNFVLFNANAATGANYYYQLSPGITDSKNPSLFKKFILER